MNESILRATFRRLMMVMATVMGVILGFMLTSEISSFFFGESNSLPDVKQTLNIEIQPNANGVRKTLSDDAPVILKIDIDGIVGGETVNRQKIEQQLLESREGVLEKDRVKGIMLTINTPGGTVVDSDSIYHALKAYKERYKTPIYAHVDGMCASGGMYIACAADKIFATDSSIIGSIGVVVSPALNFSALMEKAGVGAKTLLAGKDKDELNPFRPWVANEGANFQQIIDATYAIFLNIVSSNRNISVEQLVTTYGAKMFIAQKAAEIGYVDHDNHSYSQTLALLADKIGAKDSEYQVISFNEENWLKSLIKGRTSMSFLSNVVTHRFEVPGQLDAKFSNQLLYLHKMD